MAVLSGVRVVAFLWVFDNVYWLAVRVSQTGSLPRQVWVAAFFMLAAIWAALHHRRWGWYAMVWMTYVTIADMSLSLLIVGGYGIVTGHTLHEIGQLMEIPIGFVGLGTTFGLLNIALWIFSAYLLDVDRAYVALAEGKSSRVAAAQWGIAAIVVGVYLLALLNMGPTRTALRTISGHHHVERLAPRR